MSSSKGSPRPLWILRHHSPASIQSLAFSKASPHAQSYLISGDSEGRVAINDLHSFRPIAFWQAHHDIILTVAAHQSLILTHGRDNTIKVWKPAAEEGADDGTVATSDRRVGLPTASNYMDALPQPVCLLTLDVNALNYCPFSLLPQARSSEVSTSNDIPSFLLAVPNTLDTAWVDIYEMPNKRRLHEAIGRPAIVDRSARSPIAMAIHLFEKAEQQTDVKGPKLCLLGGYEDGSVILRQLNEATNTWEILWSLREHVESVMAFSLSPDRTFALSGSADDKIVRYPLFPKAADRPTPLTVSSKRQGKASIAIRRDSKVSAYGGWDGNVRLYDTSDLRPLAVLDYHKETVQAVAFSQGGSLLSAPDSDESESDEDGPPRGSSAADVLACGCRDGRISIWQLTF